MILCASCHTPAVHVAYCTRCDRARTELIEMHAAGLMELGDAEAFAVLQKARRAESGQGGLGVLRAAGVTLARRR